MDRRSDLAAALPKAELHLHIEGTLEPELIFQLAQRNALDLPYPSVEALRAAYDFRDLQSFLGLYYAGTAVLRTEADFYDMTRAYLTRAIADQVRHVELFFDPQSHTRRGIAMPVIFAGIARALRERRGQITSRMILCFLRHLPESDAFATLEAALPLRAQYADLWAGVGLDSAERDHPPGQFARVFARCAEIGLFCTAHAGEEGPAAYIREALDVLRVGRIDHGVRCEEDPALVARLAKEGIALTVCPLSNLRLRVVTDLSQHNLARLLRAGLRVTVNSDDPAYFGGYINQNYKAVVEALDLSPTEIVQLARNSVSASLLPAPEQYALLASIDQVASAWAKAQPRP